MNGSNSWKIPRKITASHQQQMFFLQRLKKNHLITGNAASLLHNHSFSPSSLFAGLKLHNVRVKDILHHVIQYRRSCTGFNFRPYPTAEQKHWKENHRKDNLETLSPVTAFLPLSSQWKKGSDVRQRTKSPSPSLAELSHERCPSQPNSSSALILPWATAEPLHSLCSAVRWTILSQCSLTHPHLLCTEEKKNTCPFPQAIHNGTYITDPNEVLEL